MDVSGRSVKAQFKVADREHAAYCVVVGDNELAAGTVVLKDLKTGEQTTVPRGELASRFS
jgi:histidyl-tRNA synthetase